MFREIDCLLDCRELLFYCIPRSTRLRNSGSSPKARAEDLAVALWRCVADEM